MNFRTYNHSGGPGSFFKAHKDTPRSKGMFGSLVVVFPIGPSRRWSLAPRRKGDEWTFDFAAISSAEETPSIAYIAFYSDVEHEVNMVTLGFRVTLTYNLYWDCSMDELSHTSTKEDETAVTCFHRPGKRGFTYGNFCLLGTSFRFRRESEETERDLAGKGMEDGIRQRLTFPIANSAFGVDL
ncbi:hypothetical protein K443DRAFT_14049 [Laccaria amethystina LaAM-08-1]|uniref:Prolyl 4-hydroxylase alpha subunit Fe(2+) 2OG dioxygenase domain-containing protein n=1 Tax=Laccaria amethystina LaAM-08-1 TaxID=1095629 RepID=A0A0C9WND3_9AGAR|nr:hypothetical protein K443DRAFT_14049 [Laccaria amethystina LaAM-08-1]